MRNYYLPNSRYQNGICYDTALADDQWKKLTAFLSDKLSPEDMKTVESIARDAGDDPNSFGASDGKPRSRVAYDAKTFPNSGRLKI